MVTKIPYKRRNSFHVAIIRKYCHHLSPDLLPHGIQHCQALSPREGGRGARPCAPILGRRAAPDPPQGWLRTTPNAPVTSGHFHPSSVARRLVTIYWPITGMQRGGISFWGETEHVRGDPPGRPYAARRARRPQSQGYLGVLGILCSEKGGCLAHLHLWMGRVGGYFDLSPIEMHPCKGCVLAMGRGRGQTTQFGAPGATTYSMWQCSASHIPPAPASHAAR